MGKKIKHDFENFKTIRSFGREIYSHNLSLDDALEQQMRLKDDIDIFLKKSKIKENKGKKYYLLKTQIYLLMEGKKFLKLLKVKYFQKKNKHKEKDVQVF